MRFLYKIYSGYDGFSPKQIPNRFVERKDLDLGWLRYLDTVEVGDEVWIYFHGPHNFIPGVYVKGFVRSIDRNEYKIRLRVRYFSISDPLTDRDESGRIGAIVSVRNRQVFLYPEHWLTAPTCTLDGGADSCKVRLCDECPSWKALPMISRASFAMPHRIPGDLVARYSPAYWVIPSRCYLHKVGKIRSAIHHASDTFMRFKVGEESLSYPLALGIYTNLIKRGLVDFDCIVPIPLSPNKAAAGEIHRTRLLAKELARLLNIPVVELLGLKVPISKRILRTQLGLTALQFEMNYSAALRCDPLPATSRRVLLVDDVCTEGSTLRCCVLTLRTVSPDAEVSIATAGQMIMKAVVKNEATLLT